MQIKELSDKTGLSKETIRYYEKIGLLPKAKRSESGYRYYNNDIVEKIRMVHIAKGLGFSLTEIKDLTKLLFLNNLTKKEMAKKLETKRYEIDQKIQSLQTIKKEINNVLKGNCEYRNYLG